jgi:hypothetical protein
MKTAKTVTALLRSSDDLRDLLATPRSDFSFEIGEWDRTKDFAGFVRRGRTRRESRASARSRYLLAAAGEPHFPPEGFRYLHSRTKAVFSSNRKGDPKAAFVFLYLELQYIKPEGLTTPMIKRRNSLILSGLSGCLLVFYLTAFGQEPQMGTAPAHRGRPGDVQA